MAGFNYIRWLISLTIFVSTNGLEIRTSIGNIRGKFELFGGKGLHKFLGIPYAEPPIGDLRFNPPVPKTVLQKPLNAQKMGKICPQHEEHAKFYNFTDDPSSNFDIDEDCLFMNIYVPADSIGKVDSKIPVMFYIHSGGWTWGSSSHYDGRWLAMYGKVVLVTFNYRLGVLGFLRTEDGEIINNGFKDIILAFEWVHQNIAKFGGDPERITVFGHSAGGASSVILQAVPKLRGIVKRVIALGGLPSPIWSNSRLLENKNLTQEIAELSGCHDDYLKCLKSKSVQELVNITVFTTISMKVLTAWVPWPDSVDIDHMNGMRQSEFVTEGFNNIDFLGEMGTSEGTSMMYYMGSILGIRIDNDLSLNEIKSICSMDELLPESADKIMQHFAGDNRYSMPLSKAANFMTEYASLYPLYDIARTHIRSKGEGKRTFVLLNDYAPDDRRGVFARPPWQTAAVHGDELPLVFGSLLSPLRGTQSAGDYQMAQAVMTYVTNFVKSGDPNIPEPVSVPWPQFTLKHRESAHLSRSGITTGSLKFYYETPEYWDKVYGLDRPRGDHVVHKEHDEL